MSVETTETIPCPDCGYQNRAGVLMCNMCSQVLRKHEQPASAAPPVDQESGGFKRRAGGFDLYAPPIEAESEPNRLGPEAVSEPASHRDPLARADELLLAAAQSPRQKSWMKPVFEAKSWRYHLGLGLALGLFFSLKIPIVSAIGWFFSSVMHEMGHTLISYYLGSIALPALRLDGHAATITLDQSLWLALLVWAALILGTVYFWLARRKQVAIPLLALALSYPLLAFTGLREMLFLLGGHGGETVLATIFFWRAAVISHKVREEERTLYAALGWFLWLQNLVLHWNLMFSAASRNWYLNNGSFGLENDFVRLADSLGWSLPGLSGVMLLVTLALPPAGLLWARWSMHGHMRPQASSWGD